MKRYKNLKMFNLGLHFTELEFETHKIVKSVIWDIQFCWEMLYSSSTSQDLPIDLDVEHLVMYELHDEVWNIIQPPHLYPIILRYDLQRNVTRNRKII
jgi:hypothetical protein